MPTEGEAERDEAREQLAQAREWGERMQRERNEEQDKYLKALQQLAQAREKMERALQARRAWEASYNGLAAKLLVTERERDEAREQLAKAREAINTATDWRCECGDLNRDHEAFCYRCGAGQPEQAGDDRRMVDLDAVIAWLRTRQGSWSVLAKDFEREFGGSAPSTDQP